MDVWKLKKQLRLLFYDGLENLKSTNEHCSLSFKSVNTRGFATVANTRFMQLVDGMDNFSVIKFCFRKFNGVSEIDVQSVELLPGASSALYGANAFQRILFMNSKSHLQVKGLLLMLNLVKQKKAAGNNDMLITVVWQKHLVQN
jgi:hypothetical protein